MLQLGSTFISTSDDGEGIPAHLWIVISDPKKDPNKVIIVNLTTSHGRRTATCILCKGDHPFITRDSEVDYRHARCVSCAKIQHQHKNGRIDMREPASSDMIDAILHGARTSPFLGLELRGMLVEQALI